LVFVCTRTGSDWSSRQSPGFSYDPALVIGWHSWIGPPSEHCSIGISARERRAHRLRFPAASRWAGVDRWSSPRAGICWPGRSIILPGRKKRGAVGAIASGGRWETRDPLGSTYLSPVCSPESLTRTLANAGQKPTLVDRGSSESCLLSGRVTGGLRVGASVNLSRPFRKFRRRGRPFELTRTIQPENGPQPVEPSGRLHSRPATSCGITASLP